MDSTADTSVIAAALRLGEVTQRITLKISKLLQERVEKPAELGRAGKQLGLLRACLGDIGTREGCDDLRGHIVDLTSHCGSLECLIDRWLPNGEDDRTEHLAASFDNLVDDVEIKSLSKSILNDIQSLALHLATLGRSSLHETTGFNVQPRSGRVPLILRAPEERRVDNFVPRDDIIGEIQAAFSASDSSGPSVVVLDGMGGRGKTQLALEYCHQSQRSGKYAGNFWVNACDVSSAYRANTKAALENWTEPWLLVFDGYDEPASFSLDKLIPVSKLGHVLVTTRSPALSGLRRVVSVPGVSEAQGLDILASCSGLPRKLVSAEHGKQIMKQLGHLPLAIAQAGAYISQTRDVTSFCKILNNNGHRLEGILLSIPGAREYFDDSNASNAQREGVRSAFATWTCSLEMLQRTENAEEKVFILSLLSFFAIWDISESLFVSYFDSFGISQQARPAWLACLGDDNIWSAERFRDIVNELLKHSLISTARVRTDGDARLVHISVQPLVRDWIILRLDDATRRLCFETASQMLAQDILRSQSGTGSINWTMHLSHLGVWDTNQAKLRTGEAPMLVDLPPESVPTTVEGAFANFYEGVGLDSPALHWYEWLWAHCDRECLPWPALRFAAGCGLSECLAVRELQASGSVSTTLAREVAAYATRDDNLAPDGQFHLATVLLLPDPCTEDACREARSILERLLQRPALSTAQRHVYTAHLAMALLGSPEREDTVAAQSMLNQIWEESEHYGGNDFRLANWPITVWIQVVRGCPSAEEGHIRWQKLEAASARAYGGTNFVHLGAKLRNASVLRNQGEYAKALEGFLHCVSALEFSWHWGDLLDWAREGAAMSYIGLKRFGEAKVLLAQAIKARLQEPEISWTSIDKLASHLADALLGEEDRNAMILVCDLRLGWQSLAPPQGSLEEIAGRKVDAQAQMFYAKQLGCNCHPGLDHSDVDDVVVHIDTAISAFTPSKSEPTFESVSDSSPNNSAASSLPPLLSALVSSPQQSPQTYMSSKANGWYLFLLLANKALYLSRRGQHQRAAVAFTESQVAFEATQDAYEEANWVYIDQACNLLNWALSAPEGVVETATAISWACVQARRRFGDSDATRERVREVVLKRPRLTQHLPEGEAYTEGLRGQAALPLDTGTLPALAQGLGEVATDTGPWAWRLTRRLSIRRRSRSAADALARAIAWGMRRSKQKARGLLGLQDE